MNNYDIKYKYNHSYRVKELSNIIAKSLNLSDEDIKLANVIGLLHDIGRFKQLEMYGSYDDKNIDHADLGVKILFQDGVIERFNIDKKYYKVIKFAIENHNRFEINKTNDDKELLHAKIIRDADKIDILKAFSIFNSYSLKESNNEISDIVKNDFYDEKSIRNKEIKSPNDKIILFLSFIYDINYEASFKYIKEKKIIKKLYELIKNKKRFKEFFEYVIKYIDERIE